MSLIITNALAKYAYNGGIGVHLSLGLKTILYKSRILALDKKELIG
jgi:hypothetical protein